MNRLIPHMIRMSLINARYTHTHAHNIEMMIYEYLSGPSKLYMKSDSNISVALQDTALPDNHAARIFIECYIIIYVFLHSAVTINRLSICFIFNWRFGFLIGYKRGHLTFVYGP